MKIIVAGSRNIDWYSHWDLGQLLDRVYSQCDEIVCGMARGIDMLGHRMAQQQAFQIKEFPADWNKYGKKAGFIRNEQMAEYADGLLAIWDGKSRGTKHMMEEMLKRNKPIHVELCL